MKKTLSIIALSIASVTSFIACKSNTEGGEKIESGTTSKASGKEQYSIKSAEIDYNYDMMGMMSGKQKMIFDDHGKKSLTKVDMEMMGQKVSTHSLILDDVNYSWESGQKNGSKFTYSEFENVNFNNLTDSVREKFKIKEAGTAEILGKTCKIFEMTLQEQGMDGLGKMYIWQGIPLKTEMNMKEMKMEIIATSIKENPSIPAGTFDLPKDITFKDLPAMPK